MQDVCESRPPTPPHQPTAGVHISQDEIREIVLGAYPDSRIVSISQLPPGKSYNNRIFFVTIRKESRSSERREDSVVLKVIGRFWGATKVRNEANCLRLMERFCPHLPFPKVVAWSEDGHGIAYSSHATQGNVGSTIDAEPLTHGGWLLMTRLRGQAFAEADLDESSKTALASDLGDIVASLRQNIPIQRRCGNVSFINSQMIDDAELSIEDSLQDGITFDKPITDLHHFWKAKLKNKLQELETNEVYAPNKTLAEPVRDFIYRVLPHLDLTVTTGLGPNEFVFTHYDLSPRNILVSDHPPRITGVIDLEFSGFFPTTEEFLNDQINNEGDWPQGFYEKYLLRLEQNGIATPKRFDADAWRLHLCLERLASQIAPWWLPGAASGSELISQLEDAKVQVNNLLQELTGIDTSQNITQ